MLVNVEFLNYYSAFIIKGLDFGVLWTVENVKEQELIESLNEFEVGSGCRNFLC